jgi:D-amino-acid oxidase
MPVSGPEVLIVGAGVSGLTTAVCLAEAGHGVEIRADRLPADTTSAVAGALWGPHLVETGERAVRWCSATLAAFRELAAGPVSGTTGVRIAEGAQIFHGPPDPPDWLAELGGYRPCRPDELPPGFGSGWRYAAPLIHMPTYLGYLQARLGRAGGRIRMATVASLAGAGHEAGARVVVNCSGAHARQLAGDPAVTPVRGQTVVTANPGLTEFVVAPGSESTRLAYLFPHGAEIILGGSEAAGDWNLEPIPAVARPDPARLRRDRAAADRRPGAGAPGRPAPGPPDRAAGGRARRARRRPADRAQLRPRRGWRQPVLGLCPRGRRPGRRAPKVRACGSVSAPPSLGPGLPRPTWPASPPRRKRPATRRHGRSSG